MRSFDHVLDYARVILAIVLACLLLGARVQAQDARADVIVRYRSEAIVIDGDDREWRNVEPLRLDQKAQLARTNSGEPWGGVQDASARVRLLYDEGHLYVCARILDAGPLAPKPNETWESGDVLELFFDSDLRDAQGGEDRWDDDDVQLMLLPVGDRSWAVIDPGKRDERGAVGARGDDRGFTGVEVARRTFDGGVLLEARIPLHNLPRLRAGTSEIGFNCALGDKDPGRASYHYLLWSGKSAPALDPREFRRLRFDGPPVFDAGSVAPQAPSSSLLAWLPYLLPCAFVLVLLFVARRVFRRWLQGRQGAQRGIAIAAGLTLLVAIFLPDAVIGWREEQNSSRGAAIAGRVAEQLPGLERTSFASLQGASRDAPLVSLLTGGPLRRPVDYAFVSLAELAPEAIGRKPLEFRAEGFEIERYGIPLASEGIRVQLTDVSPGDRLVFVVSDALDSSAARFGARPVLNVELVGSGATNSTEVQIPNLLDAWQGRGERSAFYGVLNVERELREVGISTSDEGRELRLEGIAQVAGSEPIARPRQIGSVSRLGTGVPTQLYGAYPKDVGALVRPRNNWRVRLPQAQAGVERIWLLFDALPGAEFQQTSDQALVGRVLVAPIDKKQPARIFDLRHQVEVFAGLEEANPELQRLGRAGHAELAYEWTEDGERRILPGVAIDLDKSRGVRELTVVNSGDYALRIRAVVFAKPQSNDNAEATGLLVATGNSGEFQLQRERVSALEGADFLVFRDRKLGASSLRRTAPTLELPAAVVEDLREGAIAYTHDLLGAGTFEAYMPLAGDGWGEAVLGVVVRDPALEGLSQQLRLLGLLLASLALPWLLVFILESLAPAGSIRVQLTGTVAFATLVPLALLSLFLVNLLERDHREQEQDDLVAALEVAEQRIDEASRGLVAGANESLLRFEDEARGARKAAKRSKKPALSVLEARLREVLTLARPQDWSDESFLAVEVPNPAEEGRSLRVFDRERSRLLGATALGPGSGMYLRYGQLFLGARADRGQGSDAMRFVQGRVLEPTLLGAWATRGLLAVHDLQGYPLAIGAAGIPPDERQGLEQRLRTPAARVALAPAIARLRERQGSQFLTADETGVGLNAAISLLRDRGGAPVALLASFAEPQPATLPLSFGALGVRSFFVAVVGLLLVLVAFVTLTITERISRPLERIGRLALRFSRGDLDVKVEPVAGADEVAHLNTAFGVMASELKERIGKQDLMNRAMGRLMSTLELDEVADEARRVLADASSATDVRLLVLDRSGSGLRLFDRDGEARRLSPQHELSSVAQADSPAIEGITCTPVEPVPITPTRFPARSIGSRGQRAVWKDRPAKLSIPGMSGTWFAESRPVAAIRKRGRARWPSSVSMFQREVASSKCADRTRAPRRIWGRSPNRSAT